MTYAWFDAGDGRQVYRKVREHHGKRSDLPSPMIISDELPTALYSGADGKQYTSKAALRATYLPSGNPDGRLYHEIGNDLTPPKPRKPKDTTADIDASLRKAIAKLS